MRRRKASGMRNRQPACQTIDSSTIRKAAPSRACSSSKPRRLRHTRGPHCCHPAGCTPLQPAITFGFGHPRARSSPLGLATGRASASLSHSQPSVSTRRRRRRMSRVESAFHLQRVALRRRLSRSDPVRRWCCRHPVIGAPPRRRVHRRRSSWATAARTARTVRTARAARTAAQTEARTEGRT